jgi:hypothetical protein
MRKYCKYLGIFRYIGNLRTPHVVVASDPLNTENYKVSGGKGIRNLYWGTDAEPLAEIYSERVGACSSLAHS